MGRHLNEILEKKTNFLDGELVAISIKKPWDNTERGFQAIVYEASFREDLRYYPNFAQFSWIDDGIIVTLCSTDSTYGAYCLILYKKYLYFVHTEQIAKL